jgi:hypothetical protein
MGPHIIGMRKKRYFLGWYSEMRKHLSIKIVLFLSKRAKKQLDGMLLMKNFLDYLFYSTFDFHFTMVVTILSISQHLQSDNVERFWNCSISDYGGIFGRMQARPIEKFAVFISSL